MKTSRSAILAIVLGTSVAANVHAAPEDRADDGRSIRLSFSDGRADAIGIEAVNEHLLKVGVRVSEPAIPESGRHLIEQSRTRALDEPEKNELLNIFALDREDLLDQIAQAGRTPAIADGGALSISEKNVPPYPKVYDMKALDPDTVAFLMNKFGRLHVNRAESGHGIDEVMTIVSGGPYTWFFALEDNTVAKVLFSEVTDGDHAWRISYPGLGVHGGYFDAVHGLVVAHAHGPRHFVMRYADDAMNGAGLLNDNPWIDFATDPPRLLDRPRQTAR